MVGEQGHLRICSTVVLFQFFLIYISRVVNKADNKDPGDLVAGLEGSSYVYISLVPPSVNFL